MSDALADRIAARLERLAEMDLAAAEHVHAQLVASREPKVTAELARAYQRASRTLRQTLMLQMKREREAADARLAEDLSAGDPSAEDPVSDAATADDLLDSRIGELQGAVARVVAATHPDSPYHQREALDRLDVELDEWIDEADFLVQPLDEMVVEACRRVGLPLTLAHRWRGLFRPGRTFDPATAPPTPAADTG